MAAILIGQAIGNLPPGVILVRWMELSGVVRGTLLPLLIRRLMIMLTRACRQVDVPIGLVGLVYLVSLLTIGSDASTRNTSSSEAREAVRSLVSTVSGRSGRRAMNVEPEGLVASSVSAPP